MKLAIRVEIVSEVVFIECQHIYWDRAGAMGTVEQMPKVDLETLECLARGKKTNLSKNIGTFLRRYSVIE